MGVAVQYARLPGESFEDYKVRICENKNVYGLTFEQIADILNAESGNTYTESKWTCSKIINSKIHTAI